MKLSQEAEPETKQPTTLPAEDRVWQLLPIRPGRRSSNIRLPEIRPVSGWVLVKPRRKTIRPRTDRV